MALNLRRWLRYAQAKVTDAVSSSEADLARREAEREVELADKPWLTDDGAAPSLETTRARIAWEAERAATGGDDGPDQTDRAGSASTTTEAVDEAAPGSSTTSGSSPGPEAGGSSISDPTPAGGGGSSGVDPGPTAPSTPDLGAFGVDEAEAAQARIELDRRDEQAAARLDAIRRELDVDPPEGEGA